MAPTKYEPRVLVRRIEHRKPTLLTMVTHGLAGVVLHESSGLESSYAFTGDEMYVRARVVSNRLQMNPHAEGDFEMAWVQPVLVNIND